jgi:acyl carrier protein
MLTTRSRERVLDELSTILGEGMGLGGVESLGEETRFFADLGLASIDAVVLGEQLQARYGASLPYGDLMAELGRRADRDLTIGELVDFLVAHGPLN